MILAAANRLPPFVCRLIARDRSGLHALSHSDLAKLSGLPRSSVADISRLTSWEGVPMDVADRFASACGVNLTRPARHLTWLRESGMIHIKQADAHQRRFFQRLFDSAKKKN